MITLSYAEKAVDIFMKGCNCSQAVFAAFADKLGIDEKTALGISCGLGGGVGRMREVCGAVSGASMVLGMLYSGEDHMDKHSAYEKVREFADKFRNENGSIICRELLEIRENAKESAVPSERTNEFYKSRPCAKLVCDAARIVEEMIDEAENS